MAENINTANFNTSAAVTAVNHSATSPNQPRSSVDHVCSLLTDFFLGEPVPDVAAPLSSSSCSSSSPSTAMIQPPVTPAVKWETGEEGAGNVNAGSSGNAGKKPAWNKPSNVATESGSDMEACIWPPLSGPSRALSISSSDSSRASLDGSSSTSFVPISQGSRAASSSSSSQNQVRNTANSIPNRTMPARQTSVNVSVSNGGFSQQPPQGPMVEAPLNGPSSRDHVQRTGYAPYNGDNDQRFPRNSFRHRNSGPHPRGNGSHNLNYGGRRNQDQANQVWNGRNYINMDGYMMPRGAPRPVRHPQVPTSQPNPGPYLAPPHGRPFGPMGMPEYSSPYYLVPAPPLETYRGIPAIQPPPWMLYPPEFQDYQLHVKIISQIDYYFSNGNLIKDIYLRQNMDDHGWVPIQLIAGFRKVSHLTNNIQLILYALQWSTVVEVQGDKVRKRYDWMRWIIPSSFKLPTKSGQDVPVARFQNLSLNHGTTSNQSGATSQEDASVDGQSIGSSSVDFGSQSQVVGNEGVAADAQGDPARSSSK
ncbi:hypothetical protein V6N13_070651 [Hibiscus sabdariffa]|uniref:HTH La-type RNA-binding domain-containing protein n=1 Tax=Hibiscus sabdariffa TaxID=183260 RepID=A0ABR2TGC5_9ROSI